MTVDTNQLMRAINTQLKGHVDLSYRELVHTRYNMKVDHFWGVRTPTVHKIAGKHYVELKALTLDKRLRVCRRFLATGVYEHRIVAFRWAYLSRKDYAEKHLAELAYWLDKYVDDWIDCDDLCIHVIGEFFLRYPGQADEVLKWARSPSEWTRRGAAVSLIPPARRGQVLGLAFEVADLLQEDERPLVRKGYGWLLKEASKAHPQEVFGFIMGRRETMPRESLRYAIEKLPEPLRRQVLEKR